VSIPSRMALIAATILFAILPAIPQVAKAQTPSQMEYERQQREYSRQQEQQRQEQQRQQQLMNENARRQQEESSRLNAPMGSNPAPAYQGASPQMPSRRQATQVDVAAAVATAQWEQAGNTLKGETDYYVARSTIHRSGNLVKLWDMYDFKQAEVVDGKRSFSMRTLWEYDCKGSRRRMLAASAYSGHIGKGPVVGSESFATPNPWQAIGAGEGYAGYVLKLACGKP